MIQSQSRPNNAAPARHPVTFRQISEHFAPGWFAAVMGTAVTAVAIFVLRSVVPFAGALQLFFLALAILLFVVLLAPWSIRWLRHADAARRDLEHPVSAAFFPTMPISLLVIGIAPDRQRAGRGRALLEFLAARARTAGMTRLLLEVRPSNLPAVAFYRQAGFVEIGRRRAYYPAREGREDAIVMARKP
jgi:GNAT superfamily N-acetyltransferase